MKVAITGTTRGLGNVIKEKINAVGLNRPAYNISTEDGIQNIIQYLIKNDVRVFINNAYDGFAQTKLLQAVYDIWKDDNEKIIININSRAKYRNLSKGYMYSASKSSLSHLSDTLKFTTNKQCKIMDINFGLLESDLPSISYDDAAEYIVWMLNAPQDIEISEISICNTKPYIEVQKLKQIKLNESRKDMGQD